jgi:hypothetical protein
MVKMSPDELSHPNHERLVLTVRCNLAFEDQGDGQQLDSAPAATLAFWILVRTRSMSALSTGDFFTRANVPFGSKADIGLALLDVRFTPKSRHRPKITPSVRFDR